MEQTKTFKVFSNGLTAEFDYYDEARQVLEKAQQELSSRTTMLAEGLYKKLQSFIDDGEVKDFFDCYSPNGRPILLDLCLLHFKEEKKVAQMSELCCSKYAFIHLGKDKENILIKTINEKKIFGSYADICITSNQTGLCFKLKLNEA